MHGEKSEEMYRCDPVPRVSPRPVLTVVGLNAFHTMVSQMFVAMKREIPEPRPYPFCRSSSKSRTIRPATKSCEC